jgi:hypothetical protein
MTSLFLQGCLSVGIVYADIEIVAEQNAQAPGEALGITFTNQFDTPVIGGGGHVAFAGRLQGTGISSANDDVIFAGIPRALRKVAQGDQQPPGTVGDVHFLEVPWRISGQRNRLVVADSSDVAFMANLTGNDVDSTNDVGVWAEIDGVLTLIAREGQLLSSGSTVTSLLDIAFTDAGVAVFMSTDTAISEIWVYRNGTLSPVIAEGDVAPGYPDCGIAGMFRPVMSPSGRIAFRATLDRDFVGAFCPPTMYGKDGGTPTTLMSVGDLLPNLPVGSAVNNFNPGGNAKLPKINERGDIIVHAVVTVPGETGAFRSSWLFRREGSLELLAFEEETLISDPLIEIDGLSAVGVCNAVGTCAMQAAVTGTPTAILIGDSRATWDYDPITDIGSIALTEAARVGQQAPVQAMGTNISQLSEPFINNSGHVAFNGNLSIGGTCLWHGDPTALDLALCTFQPVDVVDPLSPGRGAETASAVLPLTGLSSDGAGSGDGLASPFSDTGQVVTRAAFQSGTRAIVIAPPGPIDTDGDGISDYLEGGNDIDGDGLGNFEDLDSDGDTVDDMVDNCPQVANMAQGSVPLGQTLVSANEVRFEWPGALGVVAVRGTFTTPSDVSTFVVDETSTFIGRDLAAFDTPSPGEGSWYLVRPDCSVGSWVSEGIGEVPGRDGFLP